MSRYSIDRSSSSQTSLCPIEWLDGAHLLLLLILNGIIVWRLFFIDYLPHFSSIAGAFMGIADTIGRLDSNWWPFWHSGMPLETVYVPMLHHLVSLFHQLTNLSTARSYHFVTAAFYAFGPLTLYVCIRCFGASPQLGLLGSLLYSTFSPSALIIMPILNDLGGIHSGQRLRVLTIYGEGPHIAALTIIPLVLCKFHQVMQTFSLRSLSVAALLFALVVSLNSPGTVAMLISLFLLVISSEAPLRAGLRAMVTIIWGGAISLVMVAPIYWSTVFENNKYMHPAFVKSNRKWAIFIGLVLVLVCLKALMETWPFYLKYFALHAIFFGFVSATGHSGQVELIPQAGRFHLEFELSACVVLAYLFMHAYTTWKPPFKPVLALALIVILSIFLTDLKTIRRKEHIRADLSKRTEYQLAEWANHNLNAANGRIHVSGSTSFWFKSFSDIPQLTGCCDQSRINILPAGIADLSNNSQTSEQLELVILWLRAFRVQTLFAPGPDSTDAYPIRSPEKFKPHLPVQYEHNGSIIYSLPLSSPNLTSVIPAGKLVTSRADRGSIEFTQQLRSYVDAISQRRDFVATWRNSANLSIKSNIGANEIVSVGMNYLDGWEATTNGGPAGLYKDSLGLIVIDPKCNGPCNIELNWKGPPYGRLTKALGFVALLCALASFFNNRNSATSA